MGALLEQRDATRVTYLAAKERRKAAEVAFALGEVAAEVVAREQRAERVAERAYQEAGSKLGDARALSRPREGRRVPSTRETRGVWRREGV